jgi:hypothetical protein
VKKSEQHIEKIAETKRKEYIVTSPDGFIQTIRGMRLFCRDHNLDDGAMIRVAQGKQRRHKGWQCVYA